jgi:hypothetical protein
MEPLGTLARLTYESPNEGDTMIASQINITSTTITNAIDDAALAVCVGCNVTPPVITGICESCN